MEANDLTPALSGGTLLFFGALIFLMIAAVWGIFSKAGEAGWKCLIPIYGGVVFQRILGRPGWWVLLMMIPVVNIIIAMIECFDLARVFNKGVGYALGLMFLGPIFALILAFGPAQYVGDGDEPVAPPVRKTQPPMRKAA